MLPFKVWQAFLIRRHFSLCPACREAFSPVEKIRSIGVTPDNVRVPADLWENIKKRIAPVQDRHWRGAEAVDRRVVRRASTRRLAVAGAAAMILLFIISLVVLHKGPDFGSSERSIVVQNRKIIIHSIKVENRPAKTVYFQPGSSNRLIVWAKK